MADLMFGPVRESPTLADYVAHRNNILSAAERRGTGDETWQRLGVANRHIQRVIAGTSPLVPDIRREIERCLDEVERHDR